MSHLPTRPEPFRRAKCWSECWSNPSLTLKEEAAAIESGRPVAFKLSHGDHAVFGHFRVLTLTCAPVRLNLLQGYFPSPARAALPYTPVAAGSSKLDQKGGRSLMPCFQWSPLMLCQCLIRLPKQGSRSASSGSAETEILKRQPSLLEKLVRMDPSLRHLRVFCSAHLRSSEEGIAAFTSNLSQDPGSSPSFHQRSTGEATQTDVSPLTHDHSAQDTTFGA